MDKGILAASLSTIFIGFSIVIASVASKLVHPFVLITIGCAFSILFLFLLNKTLKEGLQLREILKNHRRHFLLILVSRSIMGQVILITGFSMTLAIRAVFMLRFEPVFVLLYSSLLLRERIMMKKILLVLVLLFGGYLVATNGSLDIFTGFNLGDVLIVIALAFLAYSYIPSSRIMKKVNAISLTIVLNAISLLFFLPLVLIFFPVQMVSVDLAVLYLITIYSLFFYVLGTFLWFKSLNKVKPWVVASVLALEPVAGATLAFVWLGQFLLPIQLVGGAIMIATTYLIARENIRE